MKSNIVNLIAFSIFTIFFIACSKTERTISESSPDKKIQIELIATKPTSLDPFTVTITTSGHGFKETFSTEVYSSDVNAENTKFKWDSNSVCHITFAQQDNTTRRIYIEVTSESINVREESDPS